MVSVEDLQKNIKNKIILKKYFFKDFFGGAFCLCSDWTVESDRKWVGETDGEGLRNGLRSDLNPRTGPWVYGIML